MVCRFYICFVPWMLLFEKLIDFHHSFVWIVVYHCTLDKTYLEVEKRRQITIEFTAELRKKEVCIEVFVEICQKKSSRVVLRKGCSENMQHIYKRTPIPTCDFNKVALELYWNRTLAWMFSCNFSEYFQNIFS